MVFMRKETKNWLQMVDYDIATAEHMFETRRYIYVVFMCHLSIEKMLKAVIAETGEAPPMTHNLIYLMSLAKVDLPVHLHDFIAIIGNASIPTRYPADFLKLVEAYPEEIVEGYLEKTREALQCLKRDKRLKI